MKQLTIVASIFVIFIIKTNALQLILDNDNIDSPLVVRNISATTQNQVSDLEASLALIEYHYLYIDDDDINDKGLQRQFLSALGRRRRRRRSLREPRIFRCLGNLISSKFVLTVVSCVKYTGDFQPVSVHLADHQDVAIKRIITHEDYRANIPENFEEANTNNIALIELKTEAVLSQYVAPVCLPRSNKFGYLAIDWRFTDETNFNSMITKTDFNNRDNDRYYFELSPVQVYNNGSNLCDNEKSSTFYSLKYLDQIGVKGEGPTRIGDYIDWINGNLKKL